MMRLLVAIITYASALYGASVEGVIVDQSGASIGQSVVRLLRKGFGTTEYRTESREDGTFRIEGVTAGDYVLRAWRQGFSESSAALVVHAGSANKTGTVVLPIAGCDSLAHFAMKSSQDRPHPRRHART